MEKERLVELVRQAQNGDQAAAEELLRAAYPPVSYQCRKMLKNEADAEDVTQEVLMTAYTKLADLQEPAAFWGWLNRLTATRCINAQTRWHKELQFAEDEDGNSVLDSFEDLDDQVVPDRAIDNAETARMIGELVDALPEAQRTCVMLYYFDELSVREIAAMTGVSENTVKSRLNYARKGIKEGVEGYEKQGVKLYGLSPLPFLLFFLRKNASAGLSDAVRDRTVAEILAPSAVQGAATAGAARAGTVGTATSAAAAAAGVAGTAGTTGAAVAGATAAGVAKGITIKIVAALLAGVIGLGGATTVLKNSNNSNEVKVNSGNGPLKDSQESFSAKRIEDGKSESMSASEEIALPSIDIPNPAYVTESLTIQDIPLDVKLFPTINANNTMWVEYKDGSNWHPTENEIQIITKYVDQFVSLDEVEREKQDAQELVNTATVDLGKWIDHQSKNMDSTAVLGSQILKMAIECPQYGPKHVYVTYAKATHSLKDGRSYNRTLIHQLWFTRVEQNGKVDYELHGYQQNYGAPSDVLSVKYTSSADIDIYIKGEYKRTYGGNSRTVSAVVDTANIDDFIVLPVLNLKPKRYDDEPNMPSIRAYALNGLPIDEKDIEIVSNSPELFRVQYSSFDNAFPNYPYAMYMGEHYTLEQVEEYANKEGWYFITSEATGVGSMTVSCNGIKKDVKVVVSRLDPPDEDWVISKVNYYNRDGENVRLARCTPGINSNEISSITWSINDSTIECSDNYSETGSYYVDVLMDRYGVALFTFQITLKDGRQITQVHQIWNPSKKSN